VIIERNCLRIRSERSTTCALVEFGKAQDRRARAGLSRAADQFPWRAASRRCVRPARPPCGAGRETEPLLRRWSRAKSGEGQAVLLSGEAGIGKSRLARHSSSASPPNHIRACATSVPRSTRIAHSINGVVRKGRERSSATTSGGPISESAAPRSTFWTSGESRELLLCTSAARGAVHTLSLASRSTAVETRRPASSSTWTW
jgi:hypothetical protein